MPHLGLFRLSLQGEERFPQTLPSFHMGQLLLVESLSTSPPVRPCCPRFLHTIPQVRSYCTLPTLPANHRSFFSQHHFLPRGHRLESAPDPATAASSWQERVLSSPQSLRGSLSWIVAPLLSSSVFVSGLDLVFFFFFCPGDTTFPPPTP